MGYTHEKLQDSERRRIERLRGSGFGVRQIAERLSRSISTISEEIRKRSVRGVYDAKKAAHKARVKRKYSKVQSLKVVQDDELRQFVEAKLAEDWSPEMIAGRIKRVEKRFQRISAKAIYKFVRSVYGRPFESHLYRKRVKRRGGPKRGKKAVLDGRMSIEKRPKRVQKRTQFGHFEGDFIESGRDGAGSLLVLVERKTRYPFLAYCADRSTAAVNALVFNLLRHAPLQSLTLDNDLSFKRHQALSKLIGAAIFFCHAYSSHEKGTVENRNGRIREHIPKRTDLSTVSEETIRMIEHKLRNLPMKCLGWRTPQEAWDAEMKKAARRGSAMMRIPVLKANGRCSD